MSDQTQPTTGNDNLAPNSTNDGNVVGYPTVPAIARSVVANTSTGATNNDLAHICDFSSETLKDNALKRFVNAQAQNIRDAFRAILKLLGFSDSTGFYTYLKQKLQALTRELKWIQKNVIKPIVDFEKVVFGYIQKLQAIIAWILSLPAKIAELLKDCLSALYKAVASVFSDISGGGGDTGFSDVIAAAKETVATTVQTISQATQAAAGAVAIVAVAATVPLVVNNIKKGV